VVPAAVTSVGSLPLSGLALVAQPRRWRRLRHRIWAGCRPDHVNHLVGAANGTRAGNAVFADWPL